MAIKDYSTTPDLNASISGINIAEGCAPSGINNAIRQLMADVKAESEAQSNALSSAVSSQSTRDSQQDAAISAAQTAASNAASAASAAQNTANSALNKANSITVPVTSVNGKTGAVTVGTVRTINGASPDANGAISLNISAPVTSVNGMTGAVTISSVTTATSATATPNVVVCDVVRSTIYGGGSRSGDNYYFPDGGTWRYLRYNDRSNVIAIGQCSGGSSIKCRDDGTLGGAIIGIRVS